MLFPCVTPQIPMLNLPREGCSDKNHQHQISPRTHHPFIMRARLDKRSEFKQNKIRA